MHLNGFDCYLSTTAGLLVEHTDESTQDYDHKAENDTKTVYVQAVDDVHFAFHIKALHKEVLEFGPAEPYILTTVTIDGENAPTDYQHRRRDAMLGFKHDHISFLHTNSVGKQTKVERRKLKFAAISLLDEQPERENTISLEKLKDIGELKILIRRGHLSKERFAFTTSKEISTNETTVNEKKAKGRDLSHRIGLERGSLCNIGSHCQKFVNHEPYESPFASFRFLYRSKKALQNLGLVERTPVPSPEPEQDDDEELLAAEAAAKEAEERLAELRRRKASGRAGIKRERVGEPSGIPRSKKTKPDVVDLT